MNNASIFYTGETLNENQPPISSAQRVWTIQLAEGGVDTFRTRYAQQGSSADPFIGPGPQQALADALFPGSETGYQNLLDQHTSNAASFGTRVGIGFSGVPPGVNALITQFNRSVPDSPFVGGVIVNSCLGPAERAPAINGMVRVPITNGSGIICAEIFRNNPAARERLLFDGYYSFDPRVLRPTPGLVSIAIFVVPTAFYPPNLHRPIDSFPLFARSPNPLERSTQIFSLGRFLNDSSAVGAIQVSRPPEFNSGIFSVVPERTSGVNIQLVPTNAPLPATITPVTNPSVSSVSTSRPAERSVTAGWLTVTQSQDTAPLTVNIQANPAGLPPGTYTGGVRIQTPPPSSILNQLPVTMVIPPPGPRAAPNGVVGASDGFAGAVAAGQEIVVSGSGFGPESLAGRELADDGRVATQLGGTRVLFDGRASPMVYAANGQVRSIVPFAVAGQTATVMTVEHRGVASPPVDLRVVEAIPGLFTANDSGSGQGVILNQNGAVNGPANPANPGEVIVLFGSGAGQTDPPGVDGRLASEPLPVLRRPVEVLVDGKPVEVLYAGPAAGLVEGVLRVDARLSPDTRRGRSAEVVVIVGDYRSQPGVTVAVSP